MWRPRDRDAAERFGDEEAIPRTQYPGALRLQVKCSDVSFNTIGKSRYTGLSDHVWTTRPIGGEGADMAIAVSGLHGKKANCSAAGAGTSYCLEAETFDGARNQLAIEGLRD